MAVIAAYRDHLLRYVGVGLISGSIVHASTLGGSWFKYVVLIAVGAGMFATAVWCEHRSRATNDLVRYTALSVAVSIGTGMVSGATQHYLDGPRFAAILLPLGVALGFTAFAQRDYRSEMTTKHWVGLVIVVAIVAVGLLAVASALGELQPHTH